MLAEDVMSRDPWTLPPSSTIAQVIRLMRQEQVHHLPITSYGRLVGIVSDRDVMAVLPDVADDDVLLRGLAVLQQSISTIARTEVVTVHPDTELEVVINLLLARHIGAIPVIEHDGRRLVGLVSVHDVLRAVRALV